MTASGPLPWMNTNPQLWVNHFLFSAAVLPLLVLRELMLPGVDGDAAVSPGLQLGMFHRRTRTLAGSGKIISVLRQGWQGVNVIEMSF